MTFGESPTVISHFAKIEWNEELKQEYLGGGSDTSINRQSHIENKTSLK